MHQPRTPVVGPVLLAVVAILASVAYATATVTVTRSEFTWSADRVGDPEPLVLSAQSPERLVADGPCSAAATTDLVELVSTGTGATPLVLRGQGGEVWMMYAGTQVGQVIPAQGDCRVSLVYTRADNTAVLSVGSRSTSGPLVQLEVGTEDPVFRQFAVTSLHAAPGFGAVLTTQPTTFSSSAWRILLVLLSAGSLVALGLVLRHRYPEIPDRLHAPRWSMADVMVAVVAAVSLVVVPPRFDDGWVLTTVRQYADLGFFSNYYSIDAVAQPQGFWWTWIERLWLTPLGTPGFLIRLPAVLIALGTWWFVRRHVLGRLAAGPSAVWAAAVAACAGLVGLQITIRPEPLIALLLAAAISVVVRFALTREPYLLVTLAGLSALALSAHQTGWVVVAASASVLPWALDWLRQPRAWITASAIAATGGAFLATLLMLGSNATLWWRSVRAFAADTTTYQSLLDEGDRISSLATGLSSPPVTTVAVGILILAGLGFILRSVRDDVAGRAAGWASMAAIGGLFLTSSKLVDHYGAVVPAAVVLTAIAMREVRATVALGAVIAMTGVAAAAYTQKPGLWALGLDRVTEHGAGAWPLIGVMLILLTGLAALVALARQQAGPDSSLTAVLAVLVGVSVALSLAPVVVEGVQQPGSWFGQQLAVAEGRTCGVMDQVVMVQPPETAFAGPVLGEGLSRVPVRSDSASAWARGPLFSPIQVHVVAQDGQVSTRVLPSSADVWTAVPLGSGAREVRWTQPGVAVVVVDPTRAEPAALVHSGSAQSWWVEPGLALQAPCVSPVSITDGTIDTAEFSVGRPGWVGAGLLLNSPNSFDAGCVTSEQGERGVCLVAVPHRPSPSPVRTVREAVG